MIRAARVFNFNQVRAFSAVQFQIHKNPVQTELDVLKDNLPPVQPQDGAEAAHVPQCYYPNETPPLPEGQTCKAQRLRIRHSVYKLAMVAKTIQGKHLYDA